MCDQLLPVPRLKIPSIPTITTTTRKPVLRNYPHYGQGQNPVRDCPPTTKRHRQTGQVTGSTSNSDLMNVLPPIMSATSIETDGKMEHSSEILTNNRQSFGDIHEGYIHQMSTGGGTTTPGGQVMVPMMMSHPQAGHYNWGHGHTWSHQTGPHMTHHPSLPQQWGAPQQHMQQMQHMQQFVDQKSNPESDTLSCVDSFPIYYPLTLSSPQSGVRPQMYYIPTAASTPGMAPPPSQYMPGAQSAIQLPPGYKMLKCVFSVILLLVCCPQGFFIVCKSTEIFPKWRERDMDR
eukprot:sb/3467657/